MKNLLLLFFLLFMFILSNAQFQEPTVDSTYHYRKELLSIRRAYQDSLRNNPRYAELIQKVEKLAAASDNYTGFNLYTHISSANFEKFNSDNNAAGFSSLSGPMFSIGFGFTFKKNRRIVDLNFISFGVGSRSKEGDESIRTSFSPFLQVDVGFDFVKKNNINVYPYAGLGLRGSDLRYKAPSQTNPAYTNITNIVQNNPSVGNSLTELSYQAGVGFEFVAGRPEGSGGTMFFVKAGTNRPFKHKSFNLEGVSYNPGFKYGQWIITTGFKFFGR